jgi:PPE-repeat protein
MIAFAQADVVSVQDGAVLAARAEKMSVNGSAGLVVAGNIEFGNAYAGIVTGQEIRGERIESVILLARNVEGNVTTVIDTRGALIAGLVGGLFAGIMLLLGRMIFGRK